MIEWMQVIRSSLLAKTQKKKLRKIIRIPIKKILYCFYFLGEFASKNSPAKN